MNICQATTEEERANARDMGNANREGHFTSCVACTSAFALNKAYGLPKGGAGACLGAVMRSNYQGSHMGHLAVDGDLERSTFMLDNSNVRFVLVKIEDPTQLTNELVIFGDWEKMAKRRLYVTATGPAARQRIKEDKEKTKKRRESAKKHTANRPRLNTRVARFAASLRAAVRMTQEDLKLKEEHDTLIRKLTGLRKPKGGHIALHGPTNGRNNQLANEEAFIQPEFEEMAQEIIQRKEPTLINKYMQQIRLTPEESQRDQVYANNLGSQSRILSSVNGKRARDHRHNLESAKAFKANPINIGKKYQQVQDVKNAVETLVTRQSDSGKWASATPLLLEIFKQAAATLWEQVDVPAHPTRKPRDQTKGLVVYVMGDRVGKTTNAKRRATEHAQRLAIDNASHSSMYVLYTAKQAVNMLHDSYPAIFQHIASATDDSIALACAKGFDTNRRQFKETVATAVMELVVAASYDKVTETLVAGEEITERIQPVPEYHSTYPTVNKAVLDQIKSLLDKNQTLVAFGSWPTIQTWIKQHPQYGNLIYQGEATFLTIEAIKAVTSTKGVPISFTDAIDEPPIVSVFKDMIKYWTPAQTRACLKEMTSQDIHMAPPKHILGEEAHKKLHKKTKNGGVVIMIERGTFQAMVE
mmetsp:Transcript_36213/g.57946  ORF Transcript_36213/g.57946 Transcript_36213/m.57946 type:complete len:642 (-) Transcript_36213:748-2673(-)